jgi:hypothetical protein
MIWVRVSLPYATFGVGFEDGVCVEAPPIARWALGKRWGYLLAYWNRKGGHPEVILP